MPLYLEGAKFFDHDFFPDIGVPDLGCMVSKVGGLGFITKFAVCDQREKLIHLTSACREVQILLLPKVKIIISTFTKFSYIKFPQFINLFN